MNEDNIKRLIINAQDIVKDMTDETLKVKAFELAFNQLANQSKEQVNDQEEHKPTSAKKGMSIKEFFLKHNAKADTDKVLVFGYFLEKHKAYESFNMADIRQCYFEAKEKIPLNISDKMNMNLSKGLFMLAPKKKAGKRTVILTRTGEEYVQNKLLKH